MKADELYNEGKKLLKTGEKSALITAIQKFEEAIALKDSYTEAWFGKGLAHNDLQEYAEALIAFEQVLALAPRHALAQKYQARIYEILEPYWKNFKDTSNDELIGSLICSDHYYQQIKQLTDKTVQIKDSSFPEQVEWILTLIDFILVNYDRHQKVYPFIDNKALFELTPQGKKLRAHIIGNKIIFAPLPKLGNLAKDMEIISLRVLQTAADDIFFEDSKKILRMIFEIIYHFPRKNRGELIEYLPWGKNSWYLLDFCGALFISDDIFSNANTQGGLMQNYVFPTDKIKQGLLANYYWSVREYMCITKVAMIDILENDLINFKTFFQDLRRHQEDEKPYKMLKMGELPNLEALRAYSKHTFNTLNLLAMLPNKLQNEVQPVRNFIIDSFDLYKQTSSLTLLNRMQTSSLQERKNNMNELKIRLLVLRTLQFIGQIFTPKNWGNQLKLIDFISAPLLTVIRNNLTHIEDGNYFAFIQELESNPSKLSALRDELVQLKNDLYDVAISRQSSLGNWPSDDKDVGFLVWGKNVRSYWENVKRFYAIKPPFDASNFMPNTPLLAPEEIKKVLYCVHPDLIGKTSRMLHGKMAYAIKNSQVFKPALPANSRKDALKLLKTAEKNYKALKKQAADAEKANNSAQKLQLENKVKQKMSTCYPNLEKLALSSYKFDNPMPGVDSLLDYLKNRINTLDQLLCDANIRTQDKGALQQQVHELLNHDIAFLLSAAYLLGHIIALLNKLSSLMDLNELLPNLNKNLPHYIALRNALEHDDPILQSKEHAYFQMENQLDSFMACAIGELHCDYRPLILSIEPDDERLTLPSDNSASTSRLKQDNSLNPAAFAFTPGTSAAISSSAPSTSNSRYAGGFFVISPSGITTINPEEAGCLFDA